MVDNEYVANHTNGFDELKNHVQGKDSSWASEITGIPADHIEKLASEMSTQQPVGIRIGVALERHNGGG